MGIGAATTNKGIIENTIAKKLIFIPNILLPALLSISLIQLPTELIMLNVDLHSFWLINAFNKRPNSAISETSPLAFALPIWMTADLELLHLINGSGS